MTRSALILARAALVWERAAPVLAGPAAALAVYAALALFGVFEAVGDPWRAVIALLVLVAGGAPAVIAARNTDWPTRRDAERRVEQDSGLIDRPFEALRDRPAAGDSPMWAAHAARMRDQLRRARARRPRAAWARLDPYGGRVMAMLVIALGAITAGDLAGPRLSEAFSPRILAGGGAQAEADFWIEPPDYTGRATQFLRDRREARAPEGSVLSIRVAGTEAMPRVSGMDAEIEEIGPSVRQIRGRLDRDARVQLSVGALRESVEIEVIEDTPPELSLTDEAQSEADGALVLRFRAEDDYGVESYALELAAEPADGEAPEDGWERIDIPASDVSGPDADGVRTATIPLARHRLSGERAFARMAGTDGKGQTGRTAPMAMRVPGRVFFDPLAKAVVEQRRGVLGLNQAYAEPPQPERREEPPTGTIYLGEQPERRIERAPEPVRRLALALDAIGGAPSEYYDDPVVYMGLRTALNEVRRSRELDDLDHMDADLWRIALRAELGALADAEAALAAAEQALADAFARGADELEMSALFDAYQRAMENYMEMLMAKALAEQRELAEGGGGGGGNQMNQDMLDELLEALREATELGDTEGAREALAQLSELLRNMQIQLSQGGGGGEQGEESALSRALREAMEDLSDVIGDQRGLMDDTFDRSRERQREREGTEAQGDGGAEDEDSAQEGGNEGDPDEDGAGGLSSEELAERQGALRDRLDELAEGEGAGERGEDAARAFSEAEDAMERARRALENGDEEGALAAQDDALASLREGGEAMARRLEEERQGEQGQGEGEGETDPFGRPSDQGGGAGSTDVPGEGDRQRARDILEELRDRLGDPERERDERDYIDRLLDRFGGS